MMKRAGFFSGWVLVALLGVLPLRALALQEVRLDLAPGADAALAGVLRGASILVTLAQEDDTPARDVLAAAQADYTRLVEALYAKGYYGAVVRILLDGREAAQIDPFALPARFNRAELRVDPGRAFRFGVAEVGPLAQGDSAAEGFRRGAPALAPVVRGAAQGAVAGWRDAGHPKARVAGQSVLARHDSATLDVDLTVAPGPQAIFGEVEVAGETRVRAPRVRQIAGLPRGARFDPAEVDRAAQRLRKTGTFQSVTIDEAEEVGPDGRLDMQINVVDRKPRRVGAGVELSSLDGLTLSGFWMHRNLLGGAERFRVEGEAAQLGGAERPDYSLSFRIEKPAVYGPDTLFFAQAGLARLDESDFRTDTAELTLGVSRTFNDRLTGDLGIAVAFSRVTDRFFTRSFPPRPRERELLLYSLPAALTWDSRDTALDARSGRYLRLELEPFYEARKANPGARLALDARTYHALSDRTVLAGRLQLGSLLGPEAADAPPDALFYSGGGGTVRGQPYQALGADHGQGVSLGGRSFAGLSGELRFAMTETLGLVGFADAGFVGADPDGAAGDWHAGAGLGLRYDTPVGPLRLDLAGPVGGDTGDGLQLYIGIGQAF